VRDSGAKEGVEVRVVNALGEGGALVCVWCAVRGCGRGVVV